MESTTRVEHIKQSNDSRGVVIDRTSIWGNLYWLYVGENATHEEKVQAYATQIGDMLADGRVSIEEVANLHGKTLLCWCKDSRLPPEEQKSCHGDVLAQVADAAYEQLWKTEVYGLGKISPEGNIRIIQFRDHYDFLSNFYILPKPFIWKGYKCWTTEHAYQLSKFTNRPDIQAKIVATEKNAGAAKKIASSHKDDIDPGWRDVSLRCMEMITAIKYAEVFYPELHDKLLRTDGMDLIEGNFWNDTFYGYCLKTMTGENHLGRILMSQRLNMQIPF